MADLPISCLFGPAPRKAAVLSSAKNPNAESDLENEDATYGEARRAFRKKLRDQRASSSPAEQDGGPAGPLPPLRHQLAPALRHARGARITRSPRVYHLLAALGCWWVAPGLNSSA